MANRVRIHPAVVADLTDATQWYDAISTELGDRFRNAVNDRLDGIEANPRLFGHVVDDSRGCRVAGFPYLITYRIVGDFVEVIGVYHTASDPSTWRR